MNPFHSSINSIRQLIGEIYTAHRDLDAGSLADYIPELTRADPAWFGIAITTVDGRQYLVGDTHVEFTIQSVSKPFIYGLALESDGVEAVRRKIDVEPSGEAFNSISLHPETGQPRNPMINAGAIAATEMISRETPGARFATILERFEAFAGRPLKVDEAVYRSERDTGFRNRAIANLLRNFEILEGEVDETLDAYFRQCAILVDSQALSVMGATLANGGVNPLTGERVLTGPCVERVTSVMSTCGMYDFSGNWAFEVGIPAKSGVGGGIIGVLPGQLSVAVFSPLLDDNFNSVRGIRTFQDLSRNFGLHLLNRPSLTDYVIRRSYTLAEFQSSCFRSRDAREVLLREGHRVRIFELQGDLYFSSLERLIHAYLKVLESNDRVLIDLTRIGSIDTATRGVLFRFAKESFQSGKRVVLVDPRGIFSAEERRSLVPMVFVYNDCDEALEDAEENLLAQFGARVAASRRVSLEEMELLRGVAPEALSGLRELVTEVSFAKGERIIVQGSAPDELYFLAEGMAGIVLRDGDSDAGHRVSSFTPGMSFGELSFLQGDAARTADVVALTPVVCWTLTRAAMDALRATSPATSERILLNALLSLSDRLVRANREVAALK